MRHDFFTDKKLLSIPPHCRYCFLFLQCAADRAGRLIYNKNLLQKFCFPAGEEDIDPCVRALIRVGLLTLYRVAGVYFLQIKENVWKKQRIFGQEDESKLPDPSLDELGLETEPLELNNILPPSPSKRSLEKAREVKAKKEDERYSDNFLAFYHNYPKENMGRNEIARAWAIWTYLLSTQQLPDIALLIAAAKRQKGKVVNPSTFLKNKTWMEVGQFKCPLCLDEGVIFGDTIDGRKGAIKCPRCQK